MTSVLSRFVPWTRTHSDTDDVVATSPAPSVHPPHSGLAPPQDVPAPTVIEAQKSVSVRTGSAAVRPGVDPAALSQAVSHLAGQLVKGLDRWPGSVLVAGGVLLVGFGFGTEFGAPGRLGTVEFVAALAVGLFLAVAGATVISRDVTRAQRLAKDVLKDQDWEEEQHRAMTGAGRA